MSSERPELLVALEQAIVQSRALRGDAAPVVDAAKIIAVSVARIIAVREQAARLEALEEAAKLCDAQARSNVPLENSHLMANKLGYAIRALAQPVAEPPRGGCQ